MAPNTRRHNMGRTVWNWCRAQSIASEALASSAHAAKAEGGETPTAFYYYKARSTWAALLCGAIGVLLPTTLPLQLQLPDCGALLGEVVGLAAF